MKHAVFIMQILRYTTDHYVFKLVPIVTKVYNTYHILYSTCR